MLGVGGDDRHPGIGDGVRICDTGAVSQCEQCPGCTQRCGDGDAVGGGGGADSALERVQRQHRIAGHEHLSGSGQGV